MECFVMHIPVKLIFGAGEIKKLGKEASKIGKKALLVTGKTHVRKSGLLDKATGYLKDHNVEFVHFDEIEPNPRSTTVDKAGKIARENNCDFILGIGGGSVMDASKAISGVAVSGKPIWDYVYNKDRSKMLTFDSALPIMLVPTLAATASEGNRGGVITNWETHQKAPVFSEYFYPKVSIIDPELTLTVGKQTTIDGAMDIISHVIESYFTGPKDTPLQDRFSEGIIRTVMENLEAVLKNLEDITARTNLSWSSTMALLGPVNLGRPGSFPLHFVEHVLSGHYDIAHGRGLAIMLPALMRFTYKHRPEKYASLAKNIFFVDIENMNEEDAALEFIEKFENWMKKVGMFAKLSDVGIERSKFEVMADDAIEVYGGGKNHVPAYKPLSRDDVIKLFEMAS